MADKACNRDSINQEPCLILTELTCNGHCEADSGYVLQMKYKHYKVHQYICCVIN
jgi:hypothetical protein